MSDIASEDEWYKAAYHKNDGVTGNYWDYPTSADIEPYSDQPPGIEAPSQFNSANFYKDDGLPNGFDDGYAATGLTSLPNGNAHTKVGAYTKSMSPYGTFDQGGNVWEWNASLTASSLRILRGGSWLSFSSSMDASSRLERAPIFSSYYFGFRVASIPEPACDFDNDLFCNIADINLLFQRGDLVAGVPTTGETEKYDLIDDGVINQSDIDEWLSRGAEHNGYSSQYLRGDTDDLVKKFPDLRQWTSPISIPYPQISRQQGTAIRQTAHFGTKETLTEMATLTSPTSISCRPTLLRQGTARRMSFRNRLRSFRVYSVSS